MAIYYTLFSLFAAAVGIGQVGVASDNKTYKFQNGIVYVARDIEPRFC
ncbi:hypothetical protein [Mesorhizobium sp. L-8-10]|nr:hypothetical protein [Mesorhizobium sp. L-8-10]